MTQDLEKVQGIAILATGKTPSGNELTFAFPEVVEAIGLCTKNQIAVLGVEIFLVKCDGFYANGCSDYDLGITRKWPDVPAGDWVEYVNENNELAEQCIRRNPAGDDHVYVLTTASFREHVELQENRKRRK
jgi:hypothetical protein